MIVAQNGRPLSPEQRRDEEARIDRFVREPEELRKKKRQEQEDAERTLRIVRALPDAFLFEYAGEEQSSPRVGRLGDPLVKIKFRPNPKYDPPSRIEEVQTGMQGELLIDPMRNRLAKIDGVLFKSVSFGWGILGRLDKGGHFLVTQQEVDDDDWEISRMKLNFTGKVLLLKSISIQSNEVFGDFKRVPGMTFAQGVELLKKQERPVENNSKSSGMTPN